MLKYIEYIIGISVHFLELLVGILGKSETGSLYLDL